MDLYVFSFFLNFGMLLALKQTEWREWEGGAEICGCFGKERPSGVLNTEKDQEDQLR